MEGEISLRLSLMLRWVRTYSENPPHSGTSSLFKYSVKKTLRIFIDCMSSMYTFVMSNRSSKKKNAEPRQGIALRIAINREGMIDSAPGPGGRGGRGGAGGGGRGAGGGARRGGRRRQRPL